MKTCGRCRQSKPDGDFAWRNKASGLRVSYCKVCRREYDKTHYDHNKGQYLSRNERARSRLREWLRSLKAKPCADCGGSFPPCVMDFDHIGSDKEAAISTMINRFASKRRILAEIAKCELVCANCHRIRTCARGHDHDLPT